MRYGVSTGKSPRFDVELLTTGYDKEALRKRLKRVKGLCASPAEIIESCPCIMASDISGVAAQKLKQFVKQSGAQAIIRQHGRTPLPPRQASSSASNTSSATTSRPLSPQSAASLPRNPSPEQVETSTQPSHQAMPPSSQAHSQTAIRPMSYTEAQPSSPVVATTSITLKRSVDELTRALHDKDWSVRESAVIELGNTPSNGIIRHLLKALNDDVWRVRCTTLDVLSRMGSRMVLKEMAKCVEDDVWHVRYQAVEALSRIASNKAVKPLLTALHDENWQVRQRAVQVLGTLRSKRTLQSIIGCLRDDVWHVRESAAIALARMKSEKSVKALIQTLRDPNWHVRSMAIAALREIGSERAIHALVEALSDEHWMVHWQAAYALGRIGTFDIMPLLSHMEHAENPVLSEASRKVLRNLDIVVEPKRRSLPRLAYRSGDPSANMCYIPPGEFVMGSKSGADNEKPEHRVYLNGFFIDTYEVSNYQYTRFDPNFDYPEGMDLYPVVNVTWEEAQAYAEWIGKRLPTEAEWEKAARGTDGRMYPWGPDFSAEKCNTEESGIRRLTPVTYYPQGQSVFGVHDLIGNVLEWTASRYLPYDSSEYDSPDFQEGFVVLRGGSWLHQGAHSTCATRLYAPADNKSNFIGFRCVKEVER